MDTPPSNSNNVVDFSKFDLEKRKTDSLKQLNKVVAQDKKQTLYVIFIVVGFLATAILYAVYFTNRDRDIKHAPLAPAQQEVC